MVKFCKAAKGALFGAIFAKCNNNIFIISMVKKPLPDLAISQNPLSSGAISQNPVEGGGKIWSNFSKSGKMTVKREKSAV